MIVLKTIQRSWSYTCSKTGILVPVVILSLFYVQQATAQSCMAPDCEVATVSVESGTPELCGGCSVTDEANVINGNLNDFATLTVAVGVTGTVFISAVFSSTQAGSDYAGFVIEDTQGLLDAILLGTLTLTTYLANSQRETVSGAALTLHDLGGGRKAVELLTSISFDEVRIDVGSLVDATNEIRAYYAYSSQAALPVELVAFKLRVDGLAVDLYWQTASETNNAGFEVQRRGVDTGQTWRVDGWVNGQGTHIMPHTYRYRMESLNPGRHAFRLRQIDYDGTFAYSPVVEAVIANSGDYHLSPAHPNPFAASTSVSVTVARPQQITVGVYDLLGRCVARLYDGMMPGGTAHTLRFEAGHLPAGVYVLWVEGEALRAGQQVVLVR